MIWTFGWNAYRFFWKKRAWYSVPEEDEKAPLLSARITLHTANDASFKLSKAGETKKEKGSQKNIQELRDKQRFASLDTFRGISVFLMIFVQSGGGGYWFLQLSVWNGLTVADLIAPWFVFIVGVSINMAGNAMESKRMSGSQAFAHIVWRSILLFTLGLFLNNGYYYRNWTVTGHSVQPKE